MARRAMWIRCYILAALILLFGSAYSQVIYQTTSVGTTGAEITATANGPSASMGDAIVLAGTSRYVNQVEIKVFTVTSVTPFNLTMSMYTDCSTDGTSVACGSGPGTLIPGSTMTVTNITPTAVGTIFTVLFNYPNTVDLTTETDNQINIVVNASRNDVFWILNETPSIGSIPPGEQATSVVTRCGSTNTNANNGCSRDFGVNNNFYLKVTAQATAPACSGTPSPGNTISSVTTACAGANFLLSFQNTISGLGLTYQWQSAASAAGPWTNIAGATSSTLSHNHSASTFYRCNVTCGGNTGSSTPIQVALTPASSCYCIPPASDCTADDEILNVSLNSLNNSSSGCSGAGYTYYSSVGAPIVYKGAANRISVTIGPGGGDHIGAWIDYNQNGTFETSEFTFVGSTAAGLVTTNIPVPSSALTGTTRMRVRVRYSLFSSITGADACSAFTYGETEDYNVNIQPCVTGVFTTPPASTSITCGNNATFSVVATGSLLSYSWQYRTSATAVWNDISNGGIFSGATTSTLTLTGVPGTYSGYQFRALMRGGCTAVDFSQPATLTVNPIVPVVNPASATICNGSVQALTLTNTLSNTNLFNESFSNIAGLAAAGWSSTNLSSPLGTQTGWAQGSSAVFPAYSGATDSYLSANYTSTTTVGTISNWLLTPSVAIKNGDRLTFWTRTTDGSFPDRMEVRMSTNGTSTNVGASATSVGDFTTLLLTINPNLSTGTAYPTAWTQFTATVSGLSAPTTGRFAFRYFVTNGGSAAANSDYIGLDDVVFTSVGAAAQGVWTSSPAAPNTMFTDAAATVAYTGTPATTIYVKPAVNTNYSVSFSTPTPCQSAVTTVPVSVSNPVTGLAVAPATRAVCLGGSTTFSATITGGSPVTYQWERSTDGGLTYSAITGATSTTLTVSGVTQNMTGYRYRVVATAAPCGSVISSNVGTLTVNALPVVTLSSPVVRLVPGRTTTITASSTPAAAPNGWSWTNNGGAISGNTNTQVVSIDQLGTYQATVVDVNGCTNKSNELVISAEATDKLWIYPNPTVNGAFQVRLYFAGELAENRIVTLYNPLGQVIESKSFSLVRGSAPYQRMDFNLGGGATAKGAYVVKVAHQYTGKVVSGIVLVQ